MYLRNESVFALPRRYFRLVSAHIHIYVLLGQHLNHVCLFQLCTACIELPVCTTVNLLIPSSPTCHLFREGAWRYIKKSRRCACEMYWRVAIDPRWWYARFTQSRTSPMHIGGNFLDTLRNVSGQHNNVHEQTTWKPLRVHVAYSTSAPSDNYEKPNEKKTLNCGMRVTDRNCVQIFRA